MNWQSMLGSPVAGIVTGAISSYITTALIERQKARRAKELQDAQNVFSIGVNSHMTQVAFDKHVGFCEEYIGAAFSASRHHEQPSKWLDASDAEELIRIREKWAVWLTPHLDDRFSKWESAFADPKSWTFGGTGGRLKSTSHMSKLKGYLREILRTEDLTRRRDELIRTPPKWFLVKQKRLHPRFKCRKVIEQMLFDRSRIHAGL